MQPHIENEDVIWSLQYNLHVRRTNKRMASSLQEVELDGRFLILHSVRRNMYHIIMHEFNMSFTFHCYILGLTSWIWSGLATKGLKFESPSKWNSYESFNLEHWRPPPHPTYPNLVHAAREEFSAVCEKNCHCGRYRCCLVCFSCSSASTNYFFIQMKLMLQWQLYDGVSMDGKLNLPWCSYGCYWKCMLVDSLSRFVGPPPNYVTTKCEIADKIWRRSPIFFQHVSLRF